MNHEGHEEHTTKVTKNTTIKDKDKHRISQDSRMPALGRGLTLEIPIFGTKKAKNRFSEALEEETPTHVLHEFHEAGIDRCREVSVLRS